VPVGEGHCKSLQVLSNSLGKIYASPEDYQLAISTTEQLCTVRKVSDDEKVSGGEEHCKSLHVLSNSLWTIYACPADYQIAIQSPPWSNYHC
jgi:hypothetical protein